MSFWILTFTKSGTKDQTTPFDMQVEELLKGRLWGIESQRPSKEDVEPDDQILAYAGAPNRVFVGTATLAKGLHTWTPEEKARRSDSGAPVDSDWDQGFTLRDERIWKPRLPIDEIWRQEWGRMDRKGNVHLREAVISVSDQVGQSIVDAGNTRQAGRRNPPWSYEELILALDLYLRGGLLDDTDSDVIELSRVLNALPHRMSGAQTFRNPNGVAMKLANFARFDPSYRGSGLTRGGRREEEVWERFVGREDELHRFATEIRSGVRSGQALPPSPDAGESPEVADAREETAFVAQPESPPPRRQSAAERRAIELCAMELAAEHYRDQGWQVTDVSAQESFDLFCERDGDELHVEVKGTTSDRPQVVLTANEVAHARTHPMVSLVWVSGITLESDGVESPTSTGGILRVIDPWDLDAGALEALSFAYTLPYGA